MVLAAPFVSAAFAVESAVAAGFGSLPVAAVATVVCACAVPATSAAAKMKVAGVLLV